LRWLANLGNAFKLGLDLAFPTIEDWIKEQDWSQVLNGQT